MNKNETICNICGKKFDMWDEQESFGFHYYVGYGSKFDTLIIDCDLCCDCFDKLMNEYIIPRSKIDPIVMEYNLGTWEYNPEIKYKKCEGAKGYPKCMFFKASDGLCLQPDTSCAYSPYLDSDEDTVNE